MKPTYVSLALVLGTVGLSAADASPRISLHRSPVGIELTWPAVTIDTSGATIRPIFELQRSGDLRTWQPVGQRQRATAATPGTTLTMTLPVDSSSGFYRVLAIRASEASKLGSGGAEVFGYGGAFAEELARIGQIAPGDLATLYPNPANYLSVIGWDPTQAQFWAEFAADPRQVNIGKTNGQIGYRTRDYRLSDAELALFKKNGFVVSERLGSDSYAAAFNDLWHNDLPVFVSCDAVLQAWHRTYDAMLEEMEETYLIEVTRGMLDAMAAHVSEAAAEVGEGVLRDSLYDTDYFLAVARSLLAGGNGAGVSVLGQDDRVGETLVDVAREELKEVSDFMGFCRMVDFSQFKVRGHYTHSERLGRYFKCLMWLGRIDIPVAGGPFQRCLGVPPRDASPRELGMAIILGSLLDKSGQFDTWAKMDRLIQTFVGWTDSLTFGQLSGVLAGAGIATPADVRDLATLERIQAELVAGELGVQNIRSDWFVEPLGAKPALPQTFTVFGQKFIPDSWAFSQTVYSSIQWVQNGWTNSVRRRVPGALDVAFSVLANNQVVPEIVARIDGSFRDTDRPHAMLFRDGRTYQHNLAAVRAVMDRQTPSAWTNNIYLSWLDCLRSLSAPTTDPIYPEAMRTRAWALKTLNTQLASWTQLRHDTVLYAKQSYTGIPICVYPVGYVEPRPEFWARLRQTAERTADLIAAQDFVAEYVVPGTISPGDRFTAAELRARQVAHLRQFGATVGRLEGLVKKELAQECFSTEDEDFLNTLMEASGSGPMGCVAIPRYNGWYPRLFYRAVHWLSDDEFNMTYGAGAADLLVTDVHTDVPSPDDNDPGGVLHEGVGLVHLLLMTVDNGADRFVCAGPVMSHYEFEILGNPYRLNDREWAQRIRSGPRVGEPAAQSNEAPLPPPWTKSFLVPAK